MARVSVVTPWLEHPELLEGYAQAVAGADEVIVVLNAGDPDPFIAQGHVVLHPAAPLGFAASNNEGMKSATGDVVVFLNNDVVSAGGFIEAVARDVHDGALFGPAIGDASRIVLGNGDHVGLDAPCAIPYVDGWCVAATRATWHALGPGPWDAEAFPKPYWEDVDLSLRAMGRGLGLKRAPWPVRHLGARTAATTPGAMDGFKAQRAVVEERVRAVLA